MSTFVETICVRVLNEGILLTYHATLHGNVLMLPVPSETNPFCVQINAGIRADSAVFE